jgi:hypothetical protein
MKKLAIMLLILMMATNSFAIIDWIRGDGTDGVKGTDNASDIDYDVTNYIQDPLDRALQHTIRGLTLTHTSDDVITVGIGEVTCYNAAGTIKRMRQRTTTTTVDFTAAGVGGIDSGSARDDSSWFEIYAVADADATTFTAIAAKQGTGLSDVTYYRYIGSVYNDASDNIKNFYWFGYGDNPLIMWDVPVNVVSLDPAEQAWSGAISCSTAMPSTSIYAIFGIAAGMTNTEARWVAIRPNGSTWITHSDATGNADSTSGGSSAQEIGGQRSCLTDSSQQIQYYCDDSFNNAAINTLVINVEGFHINR